MKNLASIAVCTTVLLALMVAIGAPGGVGRVYLYNGGADYVRGVSKRLEDKNRLYRMDLTTGKTRMIYEAGADYLDSIKVSPSDTIIALLVSYAGVTPPGEHDYSVLPRNLLVFVDPEGNEIATLDEDVRSFSFSPEGERVAYIAGTHHEGGLGFHATGVGIFDLRRLQKTPIVRDFLEDTAQNRESTGHDVTWARHDSLIYVRDFGYRSGNYRYDPRLGKSERVNCYAVDFSPDGEFYIQQPVEGLDLRVFRTSTNEDVTERMKRRSSGYPGYIRIEWVFDRGHLAHFLTHSFTFDPTDQRRWRPATSTNVADNALYDVERDEVVAELPMPVSRWTAGPSRLVLEKDGKFVCESFDSVYKK
jgi:hypothetical protein